MGSSQCQLKPDLQPFSCTSPHTVQWEGGWPATAPSDNRLHVLPLYQYA